MKLSEELVKIAVSIRDTEWLSVPRFLHTMINSKGMSDLPSYPRFTSNVTELLRSIPKAQVKYFRSTRETKRIPHSEYNQMIVLRNIPFSNLKDILITWHSSVVKVDNGEASGVNSFKDSIEFMKAVLQELGIKANGQGDVCDKFRQISERKYVDAIDALYNISKDDVIVGFKIR